MALHKDDILDIIQEWSCDKLLSWQCKVESAIIDIAQIMQTEENISPNTQKTLQSVIDTFTEKTT